MDLSDLKAVVEQTSPQGSARGGLAGHFLGLLREALQGLEAIGHKVNVTLASPAQGDQYPKVMYKVDMDPVTVQDEAEENQMEQDGWVSHPSGEMPDDTEVPEPEIVAPPPPAPMLVRVDLSAGPPTDVNNLHPVGPV